jgi:hypothetical protein
MRRGVTDQATTEPSATQVRVVEQLAANEAACNRLADELSGQIAELEERRAIALAERDDINALLTYLREFEPDE